MGCSCKHSRKEITEGLRNISELKEFFIKRMTEDSETHDARRRDFNQAIFSYDDYFAEWKPVWSEITMDMVIRCFDDAVKDWRRSFCDVENCKEPSYIPVCSTKMDGGEK